ncbi:hypothetical protein VTL71DRAFT_6531 [Oculimacula yallundae]|uniref:N-acetyltransferase domain-containing protein n=1 Tax=Oculimacula yallundae TaxID=86028 RepID=A0ABR4BX91_9HELO
MNDSILKWLSNTTMSINVYTPRLLIRYIGPHETEAYGRINELLGTPEDWYNDWAEWSTRGATQLFIIQRGFRSPNTNAPVVAEGTVARFIKIVPPMNEISFRIHPFFRGQGLMKEALRGLFNYLFQTYPNYQVYIETRRDNLPVIRMMEGFGLQGQNGNWSEVGSVVWRFGAAAWMNAR